MVPPHPPRWRAVASFASLSLLLAFLGCTQKVYEIELRPDGQFMQRTLTVRSESVDADSEDVSSPLPEKELDRLHAFYDSANDKIENDRHTFSGRFENRMPADVGGDGRFVHFESPLGSTSYYSERFRGEDDLLRSMQHRETASDSIITLLLNWAETEIADPEIRQRVKTFLDGEFRRDAKNVALYCWTHAMLSDLDEEKTMQRLSARVLQYLVERDYVSLTEIPRMLRVVNAGTEASQFELLRKIVLNKLGLPEYELAILADEEQFTESLRRSVRDTDLYREAVAKKREQKADGEVEESLDPIDLFINYTLQATLPNMFAGVNSVHVTLHCDTPPFFTNATWDEASRSASWKSSIDDVNVPSMVFAAWSVPDQTMQTQCFGRTVLSGESLAQFVVWYGGLGAEEKTHYDDFLAELRPSENLIDEIESFDFVDAENDSLVNGSRSLLLYALKEE